MDSEQFVASIREQRDMAIAVRDAETPYVSVARAEQLQSSAEHWEQVLAFARDLVETCG